MSLFSFAAVAATNDPCSSTFPGWQPFSEPETRAVAEFIMGHSDEWILYLTLHSYSQLWMAPWGYTTDPPHNYRQLVRNIVPIIKKEIKKAMQPRTVIQDVPLPPPPPPITCVTLAFLFYNYSCTPLTIHLWIRCCDVRFRIRYLRGSQFSRKFSPYKTYVHSVCSTKVEG